MVERIASESAVNVAERRRYSRHLLIPEVGAAGQERLRKARVLCIGAGGLGSPALTYLVAAGVGRIGIVDDDHVEASNLQRQTLFAAGDIGRPKVEAARDRLLALNPHIAVDPYNVRFTALNARTLVQAYDCIVDGSDSFATRYLVNDACVLEKKPNVFASIYRFAAQITMFDGSGAPCYRCLYPQAPPAGNVPSCAEGGVLGAIAGLAGTWQAIETLKYLLAIGVPLSGRLIVIDALGATQRELAVSADPACELCSAAATRHDVHEQEPSSSIDQLRDARGEELAPEAFFAALESGMRLLDVREPHEAVFGVYPGSLHIPLSQFDARLHEIDLHATYLVACRLGQRSLLAVARLRDAGMQRVVHLHGGLLAVAALEERMYLF